MRLYMPLFIYIHTNTHTHSRKHGLYAPAGARGLVAAAILSAASALCPSSLYPSAMSFHSFPVHGKKKIIQYKTVKK